MKSPTPPSGSSIFNGFVGTEQADSLTPTYGAGVRLAAATNGKLSLSVTFAQNTDKQLFTIHHTAADLKVVKIRKISINPSAGAIGIFGFEIRRLTGAPTGPAPRITPLPYDSTDPACQSVVYALPAGAGAIAVPDGVCCPPFEWNSTTAAATSNPSGLAAQEVVLYQDDKVGKTLILNSATLEGLAVVGRCTQAVALSFTGYIEFTEEDA